MIAASSARVGGHGAGSFQRPRRRQTRGLAPAGAGAVIDLAAGSIDSVGLDMQAVVGFAFGGQQLAARSDDLFENRNVEQAPERFAVSARKQRGSRASYHDQRPGGRNAIVRGERAQLGPRGSDGLRREALRFGGPAAAED